MLRPAVSGRGGFHHSWRKILRYRFILMLGERKLRLVTIFKGGLLSAHREKGSINVINVGYLPC